MGKCQKFGLGGSPKITKGGKGQINRQGTRAGSILGEQKEVPNVNLNKYIGMKAGGMTHDDIKEDKKLIKKAFTMHDDQLHEGKRTNLSKLKKGGTAMTKETMGPRSMSEDVEKGSNKLTKFGESAVQKRGKTKGKNLGDTDMDGMKKGGKVKKMAMGGTASARADGIASKGKTKGKWC